MRLVVAPLALAELHDAAAFYTLKANVELGLAFVAEFERAANLVLANPLLGPVFRGNRRRYNPPSVPIQHHLSGCGRGASNPVHRTSQATPELLSAPEVSHQHHFDEE